MTLPATRKLSGGAVLGSVRADLAPHRAVIEPQNKRVSVIRFSAQETDPQLWQHRMEASRVSADQKVKAFSHLGYQVDHEVLPGNTSAADFARLIDERSADPSTSAIIVQYPPPPHLAPMVQRMAPEKDIDGLLGERSQQQACATAEGIARVVRPFAQDNPSIAVIGGRGFVGSGVVRLLEQDGLRVTSLDAGDDLRLARNADIIVSATGNPHVLTADVVQPHHRLVVDSGFMPQADGSIERPAVHHPGPRRHRPGGDGRTDGQGRQDGRRSQPHSLDLPARSLSGQGAGGRDGEHAVGHCLPRCRRPRSRWQQAGVHAAPLAHPDQRAPGRPGSVGLTMLDEVYLQLSAVAIGRAVATGELSAVEVTEAALRRITLVDDTVRAFREVWADEARATAREIDLLGSSRPLAGVPLALKGTEGTTSEQAQRLLAAGCVPIGLTSTPGPGTGWQTWGWTDRGPTLNPWTHDLVPGGSSAGSAVAVATSMVPLATGSDGAGSIRIPAAWCGVLGLKLGNGRVPARDRAGLNAGGAFARHPEDLTAYFEAVAGPVPVVGKPLRVVWSEDLGFATTSPEVAAAARDELNRLVAKGVLEVVPGAVELVDPASVWTALREVGGQGRSLNDERLRRIFETVDLIATPTTPNRPHGHEGPGETYSVALTWAFNLSGHPAISLPAGLLVGVPTALQLVAAHENETALLMVAASARPNRPVAS